MSSDELSMRKALREELIKGGINPYPHNVRFKPTPVKEVLARPQLGVKLGVAGRVAAIRRHGGLMFVDLIDDGARIQLMITRKGIGKERYEWFLKYVDMGDFINVFGEVILTKKGELTVRVEDYALITKALRSPPVKWGHRLLDPEVRYRKRYLDIMMTPQVRETLLKRFLLVQEIRKFMWGRGFIEVETPILQPVYGGAEATPFVTHINALDEDWYLRISLELYLKRLIVAGYNKVFEIGKNFRNEDIDAMHNPEFTMMEAYEAYADYNDMMRLAEDLISTVAEAVNGTTKTVFRGNEIDLAPPYRRLRFADALREYAGIDPDEASDDLLKEKLRENHITLKGGYERGKALMKLFDKLIGREHLIQPTFVMDYPASASPLTKPHREDPRYAERFELYIGGVELANAYTELNDPVLQEEYLRAEEERRRRGDEEAHPFDWDFVEALQFGMPPTGGIGIGIDRLAMIVLGADSIKEVIPFPMLKKSGGPKPE